eukprot:CAMPEP_0118956074 /NCGR_PEP_ID=MMETSP1169-20130426/61027_1 /TAXON_ID=36882 /ORGANISM="Pyramimonas obovata, Strain CCMP722" /LENGTH=183 /DNA_ID=CAMNT_0006904035 /DNA_START=68 /DNA_END=615 /DNA_ORIENTATION=+
MVVGHDMRLYCWGNNSYGQTSRPSTSQPVPVTSECVKVNFNPQTVVCGWEHTVVLDVDGAVHSWGSNEFGQLGDGSEESRRDPQKVHSLEGEKVTQVACGAHSTAAVTSSGDVMVWGRHTLSNLPHRVHLPLKALAVACGFSHAVAVTVEGRLFSWGYNEHGELGHGDTFAGLRKPRQIVHFR